LAFNSICSESFNPKHLSAVSAMSKKKQYSLSSAVSDLMRAAAGGDTSKVADEDLDKYVAELIHKEAMAKNKKYDQVGLKAYQPEPK
jgi:hypothetical protein